MSAFMHFQESLAAVVAIAVTACACSDIPKSRQIDCSKKSWWTCPAPLEVPADYMQLYRSGRVQLTCKHKIWSLALDGTDPRVVLDEEALRTNEIDEIDAHRDYMTPSRSPNFRYLYFAASGADYMLFLFDRAKRTLIPLAPFSGDGESFGWTADSTRVYLPKRRAFRGGLSAMIPFSTYNVVKDQVERLGIDVGLDTKVLAKDRGFVLLEGSKAEQPTIEIFDINGRLLRAFLESDFLDNSDFRLDPRGRAASEDGSLVAWYGKDNSEHERAIIVNTDSLPGRVVFSARADVCSGAFTPTNDFFYYIPCSAHSGIRRIDLGTGKSTTVLGAIPTECENVAIVGPPPSESSEVSP